jgi:SAM-dependent methyltransferase
MTPAESYQATLVPAVFEPWALRVLDHAWPAHGQHALDVACGTGTGARELAPLVGRAGRVVGIDIDAAMLEVARATSLARSDAAEIEWQRAGADRMPFPAAEFDFVLCLEGIPFFPQRLRALREMRRVTRPGGRLAASVWAPLDRNPAFQAIAEALQEFVGEDAGRLPPWAVSNLGQIADLLVEAGWRADIDIDTLSLGLPPARDFVDWIGNGAPTIRDRVKMLADDDREAFAERVAARLARYAQHDGSLSVPSARYVIVAH